MIFGLFKSELLIFWEHKSKWVIHSKNKAICSFINLCDLLTFAHLSWATWANCSHFLICPEQFEQMSEWVNSHPSTSVPLSLLYLCTSVPLSLVHLYTCTMYTCTVHHYVWGHLSLWYPPLLSSSVPCLPLHLSLSVPYVMYLMQLSTSVLFMHLHPSTSAHFGSLYLCTSVPSVILVPSKDRFQFLIPLSWCVHIRGQSQNRKSSTADTEMQRHNYFLWLFGLIQTRVEQILPAAISLFCTTEVSHWWR